MKFTAESIQAIIKASKDVSYNFKKDSIKKVDLEFSRYFMEEPSYFKLLTATAMTFPDAQFVDMGTFTGASAVAYLYGNPSKKIYTYDTQSAHRFIHDGLLDRIDVRKEDVMKCKFEMGKIDIIFLDISHNGDDEADTLRNLEAQGVLTDCMVILDDINLNDQMKKLWAGIEADVKMDITADGHATGTGVFIC